jgi:hypothetical protein
MADRGSTSRYVRTLCIGIGAAGIMAVCACGTSGVSSQRLSHTTADEGGILAHVKESGSLFSLQIRRYRKLTIRDPRRRDAWERLAIALFLQARGEQRTHLRLQRVMMAESCTAWLRGQRLPGKALDTSLRPRLSAACKQSS